MKQKGVTLIVLVITIILLIILAGVTIATLVGDKGILYQAGQAKEQSSISSIEEKIQLAKASFLLQKEKTLSECLETEIPDLKIIYTTTSGKIVAKYAEQYTVSIYEDKIWVGEYIKNTLANNGIVGNMGEIGFLTDEGIARKYIRSIEIETSATTPDNFIKKWDVSETQDGTIIAYAITGDETQGYDLKIVSNGVIYTPKDSVGMFKDIGTKEGIRSGNLNLEGLDTSYTVNMERMFSYCGYQSMTDLNLGSHFSTGNVTNMNNMFSWCGYNGIQTLNLGDNFDTKKVTNMANMFAFCGYTAMSNLNLGKQFDTSNVIDMSTMFSTCGYRNMTKLDLGNTFNTSKVVNMSRMFEKCGYQSMENLDLGNLFDTGNVTNMNSMFTYCGFNSMKSLHLGGYFNTTKVENMDYLFRYCGYKAMSSIIYNGTKMDFERNCANLITNASQANFLSSNFPNCKEVTCLDSRFILQ